jgi:hypothetical protein
MAEPTREQSAPQIRIGWVLAAIVLGFAIYNTVIAWLFSNSDTWEWFEAIVIGSWVFQPMLFAVWAALGPGRLAVRIPLVVLSMMLVIAAPGIRQANFADTERYEFITLTTAAMTLLVVTSLLLLVARRITGWQIVKPDVTISSYKAPLQFDIKYLLLLVTLCGIALGLTVSLEFSSPRQNLFLGPEVVIYILAVGSALASLLILPVIAVPLIVLKERCSARFYWRAIAVWLVLTLGAVMIFNTIEGDMPLLYPLLIQLGAAVVGFAAALSLRLWGWRLVHREPTTMEESPNSP